MQSIFEFSNYRGYLNEWIESQGPRSYGLKGRLAEALNVSSSLVSQILSGKKTFTPEQASDLSDHLGLNPLESDYLHLLIEFDRAGSHKYKAKLLVKINQLQTLAKQIGKRVPRHKELTDEQKAIYYSSWLYTGIRNLTATPNAQHLEDIARHLHLETSVVSRILRFLLENGLCVEAKEGGFTYGPASTHVDSDSPFVNKHHQNWRFQAINEMEKRKEDDLFFTSPMSLSVEAAEEIRRRLPSFIQDVMKIAGPSESEIVACLNIDWFKY